MSGACTRPGEDTEGNARSRSPRAASWIADEAAVSENTARGHLKRLIEMNLLLKGDRRGTAVYAPDPLHNRMQTLRDLLDEYDHDGLVERREALLACIESWQEEYGVDSPRVLRTLAAEAATAKEAGRIRRAANEWEVVEYRLGIVEEAIENYATYSRGGTAPA